MARTAVKPPRLVVGCAIMAHPKRKHYVPAIERAMGRPTEVAWDRIGDRWDTGRRALLACRKHPKATHWMVLQDDAVPCRDLPAGVELALTQVPEHALLGLYAGRTRAWQEVWRKTERAHTNLRWVRMAELMWGVGVVVPTSLVEAVVGIGDSLAHIPNYDSRISAACMRLGIPVYYPWPSLVSHRASPSLVEGRGWRGRYAYKFIGSSTSALSLRWKGAVADVEPPRKSIGRSRALARAAGARRA